MGFRWGDLWMADWVVQKCRYSRRRECLEGCPGQENQKIGGEEKFAWLRNYLNSKHQQTHHSWKNSVLNIIFAIWNWQNISKGVWEITNPLSQTSNTIKG